MKLIDRIKYFILFFFISICFVSMTSCGNVSDDHYKKDCRNEIKDRVAVTGDPDAIDTDPAESDSYHSHTYWYMRHGFAETFTCGDNVDGCEMDVITFCPDTLCSDADRKDQIIVSPSPISGPNGKIIRFVVFGADETPEVIVVTQHASFSATLTTIDFQAGVKYFGRFDVPQNEIVELIINGQSIPWDGKQ